MIFFWRKQAKKKRKNTKQQAKQKDAINFILFFNLFTMRWNVRSRFLSREGCEIQLRSDLTRCFTVRGIAKVFKKSKSTSTHSSWHHQRQFSDWFVNDVKRWSRWTAWEIDWNFRRWMASNSRTVKKQTWSQLRNMKLCEVNFHLKKMHTKIFYTLRICSFNYLIWFKTCFLIIGFIHSFW